MNCDITQRAGFLVCRRCGWWASSKHLSLPLARLCSYPDDDPKKGLRGLGDTIAVAVRWTGLASLASQHCGCDGRQAALNRALPYQSRRRQLLADRRKQKLAEAMARGPRRHPPPDEPTDL